MKTKVAFKSQQGKSDVLKFYDSLVDSWSLPHEKIYINTRYGKTYIIASGDKNASPLILLHGSGMNSVMWLRDIKDYSRNYRVYAVDIPGEPGRSEENQLPLNDRSYADWLNDVFNALSIEKAGIVGISLGAWLSIKFSISYPEKVGKLVLIAPSGIGSQKKSFLLMTMLYMILGEKGVEKLYYKVNGNKPIPEAMLNYQKLIRKNFNYRLGTIPLFSDQELQKLTMPTALFVGGKDIMLHSEKTAKRLGNLLPYAKINILSEAGHSIVNIAEKIITFLESK